MHYLDYNATAPLRNAIREQMIDMLDIFGNPSSVHLAGRKAKSILENSRETIAEYCGVLPNNIIFTSSATEANHLIIRGTNCDVFITSPAEHDCVLSAMKATGKPIYYLKHLQDGCLDKDSFDEIITHIKNQNLRPFFSLMKVNNETGVIQAFDYFFQNIRDLNGIIHSDAVQAFGKIPFADWSWQTDTFTLAGHKVGAGKGVGVLVIKQGIELCPQLTGGGQEMRLRAGTENIMAISSLKKLTEIISDKEFFLSEQEKILNLRNSLEKEIKNINPNAIIIGDGNHHHRVNNTICVVTAGIESEKQVIISDLNKVCVSAGSACSSGKVKKSHVLTAYGYDNNHSSCSLRISLGHGNNTQDITAFTKAYKMIMSACHS